MASRQINKHLWTRLPHLACTVPSPSADLARHRVTVFNKLTSVGGNRESARKGIDTLRVDTSRNDIKTEGKQHGGGGSISFSSTQKGRTTLIRLITKNGGPA